jgi:DNA-binding CsgD family transcriptional regulator
MNLNEKEKKIIDLLIDGKERKQIAIELGESIMMIHYFIRHMVSKTQSKNYTHLISKYTKHKIQNQTLSEKTKYYRINDLDDLLSILANELEKYHPDGEIDYYISDKKTLKLKFEILTNFNTNGTISNV